MKLVWSEAYDVDLFGHVFPVEKYRLIRAELLSRGIAAEPDFIEAPRANREDILLVHTPQYFDDLINRRMTHRTTRSEMALTSEIVEAYVFAAGGTIAASDWALADGVCVHIGGGYHHAYPDHAEGFCYLNDVSIAVAKLKQQERVKRVCVIDCDLHQGNGTAFIFAQDPDVFTFSIHQENNYPPKERSDLDIGLPDGADDELYLRALGVVGDILDKQEPQIAFYLAGADPFCGDKLGGLCLTKGGLKKRDELVFAEAFTRRIPVCVVLAGGYAVDVSDDVEIHLNTIIEAQKGIEKQKGTAPFFRG
jgi:acetoin utilization deacetylase AcuC-like enzyme